MISLDTATPRSFSSTLRSRVRLASLVWAFAGCQMPGHFSMLSSARIFSGFCFSAMLTTFSLVRRLGVAGGLVRLSGTAFTWLQYYFSTRYRRPADIQTIFCFFVFYTHNPWWSGCVVYSPSLVRVPRVYMYLRSVKSIPLPKSPLNL